MRILFAGTPEVSANILEWLVCNGHEVTCVLTRTDSYVGRKKVLTPSLTAVRASELGIPVIKANRIDEMVLGQIKELKVDLAIVVAYGSILNKDALEAIPHGWYNLHFSLLPKHRGAAPVQRALLAGDTDTGVTIFKLDQGMDTGPILSSIETSIGINENAGDLLRRLAELAKSLLSEVLPNLYAGTFELKPQTGEASTAPKPSRDEARLNFSKTAIELERVVRGMNPEPMAWCFARDENLRVLSAVANRSSSVSSLAENLNPGAIFHSDGKVFVVCGQESILELIEVQPSSKRPMSARDWFNGNRGLGELR